MEIRSSDSDRDHRISNLQLKVSSILDLLKMGNIELDETVIEDITNTLNELEIYLIQHGVKQ